MDQIAFNRHCNLYQEDLQIITENIPWEKLIGKAIAVTGATGLLGTLIIDTLVYLNTKFDANIRIVAMGRSDTNLQERFSIYSKDKYLETKKYEITEVFPDIKVDYIINCAGNSHPKLFAENPVGTLLENIKGAENVLRYATKNKAIVLILSSGEIYGENTDPVNKMKEDFTGSLNLNDFRSCYSEGKRAVESLCQSFAYQYKAQVKIARPCRIFGPTMTKNDNKASAQFLKNAKNGKNIILKSDGTQLFSYIYAVDAVIALFMILLNGENAIPYNISNSVCNVRLKDFASKIANHAGVELIINPIGETGGSKVNNALLDNSRLMRMGVTPIFDIDTAIVRTLLIMN